MSPRRGPLDAWKFAVSAMLLFTMRTHADDLTYIIDPLGSYLEVTALTGTDIDAQFPGSDALTFQGCIDLRFHDDTVQFLDTTLLQAIPQSKVMPRPKGRAGTASADAGLVASLELMFDSSLRFTSQGPVALRQVQANLLSDPLPIVGGTFAARAIKISLDDGTLDYRLTGDLDLIGSVNISGAASPNEVTESGCFLLLGSCEYLSIPISVSLEIPQDDLFLTIELEGEIAAYRERKD